MNDLSHYLIVTLFAIELIVIVSMQIAILASLQSLALGLWLLCIFIAVAIFIKLENNKPTEKQRENE